MHELAEWRSGHRVNLTKPNKSFEMTKKAPYVIKMPST